MKFYLSLPGLFPITGHPSTGHAINFSTRVKKTTYFSIPPPPTSTPRICFRTIPCGHSILWHSDDCDIAPLHSLQPTLFLFRSQNVSLSPIALLLYAADPNFPQMKPGLNTIALVLPNLFCSPTLSKILTTAVSVAWTYMGLRPTMWQSSA